MDYIKEYADFYDIPVEKYVNYLNRIRNSAKVEKQIIKPPAEEVWHKKV